MTFIVRVSLYIIKSRGVSYRFLFLYQEKNVEGGMLDETFSNGICHKLIALWDFWSRCQVKWELAVVTST